MLGVMGLRHTKRTPHSVLQISSHHLRGVTVFNKNARLPLDYYFAAAFFAAGFFAAGLAAGFFAAGFAAAFFATGFAAAFFAAGFAAAFLAAGFDAAIVVSPTCCGHLPFTYVG